MSNATERNLNDNSPEWTEVLGTYADAPTLYNAAAVGRFAHAFYRAIPQQSGEPGIVCDWPPCNPLCDYEDPNSTIHDCRSKTCSCDAAKASIARQCSTPPTPTAHPATTVCYQAQEIDQGDWHGCSKESYDAYRQNPAWNTRVVTATPQLPITGNGAAQHAGDMQGYGYDDNVEWTRKMAREALTKQAAPAPTQQSTDGEAVNLRYGEAVAQLEEVERYLDKNWLDDQFPTEAIWDCLATPPAKQVLSDEQIEALVRKTYVEVFKDNTGEDIYDNNDRKFYGAFCRAIIAASTGGKGGVD